MSEKDHCSSFEEDNLDKSTCGVRYSSSSLIVGGTNSTPGAWPWMARLLYKTPDGTESYCGGTLISRRHVVTAGHCMNKYVQPIAVVLGDSDITTDYDCLDLDRGCSTVGASCADEEYCAHKHVEIKIKDIIKHDKFNHKCARCLPKFDVALIVLERTVDFTDFIQPACLPKLNVQSKGPLIVTGWGTNIAGWQHEESADILQELNVDEVPLAQCITKYRRKYKEELLPSHMCASTGVIGKSSCQGDSGGPVVRNSNFHNFPEIWELAGVVSFGIRTCGNVDFPMGFTRIEGEVNSWLQQLVGREMPSHPT